MDFGTVETVAENGVDGPPPFVQTGAITSGSHLATILGRLFRVREGLRKLPSVTLSPLRFVAPKRSRLTSRLQVGEIS